MAARTSITLADCGNFAAIKTQAETVKSLTVSTIYGICTDISQRKSPDKITVFQGLMGDFRMKPAGEGEVLDSTYLYFPPEFNTTLLSAEIAKLRAAGAGNELRFIFELQAVRAANEAGYSVNFVRKIDPVVVNRIDGLIADATPDKPAEAVAKKK